MSRLFGYMGSESERLRCALFGAHDALVVPEGAADGWGVGFYQAGELLLQKRPRATGRVDLYTLLRELRTDLLLGHVRAPHVDRPTTPRTENTPPFRFRQWLFAAGNELPGFDDIGPSVLECIPEFLRRNIRGDTPSEQIFHLFLSFLRDGGKLDDGPLSMAAAVEALGATLRMLDQLFAAKGIRFDGKERAPMHLVATNGQFLLGLERGRPLWMRETRGIPDCPVCREPDSAGRRGRTVAHEHLRSVLLLSELGGTQAAAEAAGFRRIEPGTIVLVGHDLKVATTPLG